jgi:hypothetical protein
MPASIPGLRGTGQFTTDFRPTNYRELYTLLEPNGTAPLNALLSMGQSEATDDSKYNNFRDELPDRTLKINNAAGYASGVTTLQLDVDGNTGYVLNGSIVVNSRTGEVMLATVDGNNTTGQITVTRNIGGTAYAILDNDDLFVAGFAGQEGGGSPTAITFDATVDFNYTQIFKTAFQVTGSLDKTYLRTGNKYQESMEKALKLHMSDIERAHLFSIRNEINGSTSQPTRTTGGIINLLTSGGFVEDVATYGTANTMTEDQFDRLLMNTIFAYGSKTKLAFVGATVAGHLQKWGKNKWTPQSVDGAYGVNVVRYQTFSGDLLVHLHPQFRQIPGMANSMLVLDFPFIKYRYLQDRDTNLQENIQNNDADAKKSQYMTDCGLELLQGKVHRYIKNWSLVP